MTTMGAILLAERAQEGINKLAEEVETIWRRNRPRLMRRLDRTKRVKDRTQQAADLCQEAITDMQENGVPFDQAERIALYQFVYLPDLDNEDNDKVLFRGLPS